MDENFRRAYSKAMAGGGMTYVDVAAHHLAAIYFTRPCCGAPLDKPHDDDCPVGIQGRQDDDWYCQRGDDLGVNGREKDYGYAPPKEATAGETIRRAFEATD